jgi:hypothetical protein
MARIKGKDLYLNDDDQIYFGDNKDSSLWFDAGELQLSTTISGVSPTEDYHLTTKGYVDLALSTRAYVDGDDVYFYDSTRDKDLGVAVIQIGCGRNSANTTTQYLRTFNGIPMNLSGVALPFDATLVGIAMSGGSNTQSWTAQIGKNDVSTVITSLSITNAYENHTWSEDTDFDEGDRIQVRMTGTNINYPQVRLYFRRRKQ